MSTLPGQDTLLECWRALARVSPGARVLDVGPTIAAVFPAWEPLNNAVLRQPTDGPSAAAAVEQLASTYRGAGVTSWALWLPSPAADLDTPDEVTAIAGLERDTTTLVMRAPVPTGLRRHEQVLRTTVFAAATAGDTTLDAADLPPPHQVEGLDAWVLVHAGLAVAGAWTYLRGTDVGVYAVGTTPQARRQGFARSLMEHVLSEAFERGARTATLQSSRMAEPLYRSLGFEPMGRYEEWLFRPRDQSDQSDQTLTP